MEGKYSNQSEKKKDIEEIKDDDQQKVKGDTQKSQAKSVVFRVDVI